MPHSSPGLLLPGAPLEPLRGSWLPLRPEISLESGVIRGCESGCPAGDLTLPQGGSGDSPGTGSLDLTVVRGRPSSGPPAQAPTVLHLCLFAYVNQRLVHGLFESAGLNTVCSYLPCHVKHGHFKRNMPVKTYIKQLMFINI